MFSIKCKSGLAVDCEKRAPIGSNGRCKPCEETENWASRQRLARAIGNYSRALYKVDTAASVELTKALAYLESAKGHLDEMAKQHEANLKASGER